MDLDNFLKNLSNLILLEIGRRKCTITSFADSCGISRSEMNKIINRNTNDIKVSTVLKICDSSAFGVAEIFNGFSEKEKIISNITVLYGQNEYYLKERMADR